MKHHPSLSAGESQCSKLLSVLEKGGEYTVPQLIRWVYKVPGPASARLAARIYELKDRGYNIVTRHYKVGKKLTFTYQLKRRVNFKYAKKA